MQINWQIGDLMEYRGKQELFIRQVPQKLKALREHALIESAVSSNRIEGVEVDQKRVKTLVFGATVFNDRDEEEVAGYRKALGLIHTMGSKLPLSEENMLRFHNLSRGVIWDSGKYKDKPVDIVEILPNGEQRIRFKTASPEESPEMIKRSMALMDALLKDCRVQPLVLLGALNLDFLCIHPFRDGNGRVSRLLFLQTCYHLGFEAGRYVSLERIIEQNKERYYETLQISSKGWHEGRHDPWPYIGFLLFILKQACQEFEERVGQLRAPRGAKAEMVMAALRDTVGEFTLQQLEAACPGVGRDWIRSILSKLKEKGEASCRGKGRAARWVYLAE